LFMLTTSCRTMCTVAMRRDRVDSRE